MREVFAPRDIEAALVAYLSGRLGVPVSTDVPPERPPGRFVTLQRLDGIRPNLVQDQATVILRFWSSTEDDAEVLGRDGYRALDALGGQYAAPDVFVYWPVRIQGPASDPDTKTGTPRRRLAATLRTRLIVTEETS